MNQPPADPLADARVQRLIVAAKRAIDVYPTGHEYQGCWIVAFEPYERLRELKQVVEEIER